MKSKRLILYLLLLIIVITVMIILKKRTPVVEVRDLPQIENEGILRLITEYNQSGYYVSGDTIEGFQYELSQAISKLSGLQIEVHLEMNLSKSFEKLDSRECDIIARNIPVNIELKDKYLFTDPLVLNKQVLVQRTAEANNSLQPLRNQLELAGKTIYVPKDSPALFRLKNLEEEIGDSIYIVEDELYSSEQLIIMVAKEDIEYAVCDMQIAKRMKQQFPQIDIQTDVSFTQLQSWAVRKESEILLDSLNIWFTRMKDSGLYKEIYRRYYSQ